MYKFLFVILFSFPVIVLPKQEQIIESKEELKREIVQDFSLFNKAFEDYCAIYEFAVDTFDGRYTLEGASFDDNFSYYNKQLSILTKKLNYSEKYKDDTSYPEVYSTNSSILGSIIGKYFKCENDCAHKWVFFLGLVESSYPSDVYIKSQLEEAKSSLNIFLTLERSKEQPINHKFSMHDILALLKNASKDMNKAVKYINDKY